MSPDPEPAPLPTYLRSVHVTYWCPTVPTSWVVHDNGERIEGTLVPADATGGQFVYEIPATLPVGNGVSLKIRAEGFQPIDVRFVLRDFSIEDPAHDNEHVRVQHPFPNGFRLKPVIPPILPIVVNGEFFETADGQPWSQIGCSDFRIWQRFLAGEDIEPVLRQRDAIGFNQLRVFLMCDWMFHLYPQERPDYFGQLPRFLDRLAARGLRSELTVLVDATRVMPNLADQQSFFRRVCEAVRGRPDVFVELVNENEQTINTVNTDAFERPAGIICCHGSKGVVDAGVERVCVTPVWSYGTLHPGRGHDWPRLGHNIMEDIWERLHVAGTINESCRPDQGGGAVPRDFFDAAVNIALMGAGGTFHSQAGKASTLFAGPELECARAWVAGARAVDLSRRRGAYTAGHLTGYPLQWHEGDSVRAHGRIAGSRAACSLPQMRAGYVPTGANGWRVTKQNGSYVECER